MVEATPTPSSMLGGHADSGAAEDEEIEEISFDDDGPLGDRDEL